MATQFTSFQEALQGNGLAYHPQYSWLAEWPAIVAPPAAYLVLIMALRATMGKRTVSDAAVKPFMRLYNLTQVLLCVYMAHGLYANLLAIGPALPPAYDALRLPNLFGINTPYNARIEHFILVHYLSKYLDFFDTVFMVLRGKSRQVTFLHLYHHCTISVVWGYLLHTGHANGTCGYGAFINSVIHIIMYSHYLITSFGVRNPLKRYITAAQIAQFYSCIAHALLVIFSPWEHHVPRAVGLIQVAYHITMIALFSNFYSKSYAKAGAKKSQ